MKMVSIGGGPAGLYGSILLKKAFPDLHVDVYERNQPDDTFGWGVVFSSETLGHFDKADSESYTAICENFAYWDDINTWFDGSWTRTTGHGFCGMSRQKLLNILQSRASELGVNIHFGTEIESLDDTRIADADLILGVDGINSLVRDQNAEHFRPTFDWRKCRFAWLGTSLPLDAFTFIFKESPHGLFQVHAYPFEEGTSTFIVECREEVWEKAGLADADEAETLRFCQELFGEFLEGHSLRANRSMWRVFPTIKVGTCRMNNVVLMGDAAHTAHFSIGSGTKLAMEDAIALTKCLKAEGMKDIPRALEAYEKAREVDVLKLQKTAQTSLAWFENSARYLPQDNLTFNFNLLTRSKRITYGNLKLRDPDFVKRVTLNFAEKCGAPMTSQGEPPPPAFTPYSLGKLKLTNRIVVSPMCQYRANEGVVNDWHLVHLGSRAIGGAGLILTEMTDVTPEGRITTGCAGIWNDEQMEAWTRIVDFVHSESSAAIGIQIAHSGRKGSVRHPWDGADEPLGENGWKTLAPSAIPFDTGWPEPTEMTAEDCGSIRDEFVAATKRAATAGFDVIELHMAHGYLLSSFLSPASNQRRDEYGGDLESRMRFPLEVMEAVRAEWPDDRPICVRISATDWLGDDGMTAADSVILARELKRCGADAIDVSTAGNTPASQPIYGRMYQVPFAEKIRAEVNIPVMAVGAIQDIDHCNTILAAGRADLCCMARPHLRDPYLALRGASESGFPDADWPGPYLAGRE